MKLEQAHIYRLKRTRFNGGWWVQSAWSAEMMGFLQLCGFVEPDENMGREGFWTLTPLGRTFVKSLYKLEQALND